MTNEQSPSQGAADDRYLVVSTDSHVGPPIEAYRPYCPHAYLEQFDEAAAAANESKGPPGRTFERLAEKALGLKSVDSGVLAAAERANLVAGQWDPEARRADMDKDGVAADIIFHGTMNGEQLPFVADALFATSSTIDAELEAVGCRMYNQWLADFISGAPHRHVGLAYVPWSDIDRAVKEMEWAREAGLGGLNFPAPNQRRPYYTDSRYEPIWAAAADLEMPLATHTGGGDRWNYDDGVLGQAFQKMELGFVCRRGIWQMTLSGVFERHPKLKLVMTEIYAAWVNEMLRDLDFAYVDPINPPLRERIPKLPSEYWLTNCFVAASFLSHDEALLYPDRGAVNLMWGSDYPHVEGTHPYTRLSLRTTFAGIPQENVRPMVGETAVKVYGLDADKLGDVAADIGPTVDELWTVPEERPDAGYMGYGFRRNSSWPASGYREMVS